MRTSVSRVLRGAAVAAGVLLMAGALAVPYTRPALAGATALPDSPGEPVPFGGAAYFGSPAASGLHAPVVAMAATPTGRGYWLAASDGGVFTYGTAHFYGSAGDLHLDAPVVGIAAAPTGHGYWLVTSDGGVFTFGAARFHGSMGGAHLAQPVVGMAADAATGGYWEVAADGGVFAFDAPYDGSMGGKPLDAPVVGMAATHTGNGYWLVASDGGVFAYGTARYHGSMGGQPLHAPVVGMAATPTGEGYWLVASDGGVFTYGTAQFHGSMATTSIVNPVVGIAAVSVSGYWLLPGAAPPGPTLGPGSTGAAVLTFQRRLSALGYWLGTPNGTFGDTTEQAVYALQKAAGLTPNGIVGPSTYAALDRGVLPQPRSASGYLIEVDLQDDLVMFVTNGKVDHVLNTSTGGGYTYTATGVTSVAVTPQGHFQIYREVDGWVVDSLGALWRPKFFDSGFAIHGDTNVPPVPVSHGCVRVSLAAINWIWANNLAPIGTAVWIY